MEIRNQREDSEKENLNWEAIMKHEEIEKVSGKKNGLGWRNWGRILDERKE